MHEKQGEREREEGLRAHKVNIKGLTKCLNNLNAPLPVQFSIVEYKKKKKELQVARG